MMRRNGDGPSRIRLARLAGAPDAGAARSEPGRVEWTLAADADVLAPVTVEPAVGMAGARFVLILDESRGEAVIATEAAQLPLSPGSDGEDFLQHAARLILHERNRQAETGVRAVAAERMVFLAEHLSRQRTNEAVFEALSDYVPKVLRSFSALLYVREADDSLRLRAGSRNALPAAFPAGLLGEFETPGLVTRATATSRSPAGLAALLDVIPATSLACVAVGRRALFMVVERRAGRVFAPEEWYWLRSIARQADATLERIELRSLSNGRRDAG